MEIELGWGSVFSESATPHSRFSDSDRTLETRRLEQLLALCEEYDVPFSFDVVGHLIIEDCHNHDAPHSAWFETHDPSTDVSSDPLYYAPDLIEQVADSSVDHEICTHTFSHVPVDEMDREEVGWELAEARRTHEGAGYGAPTSLVTPQHRESDIAILEEHDISVLRTPRRDGKPVDGYPEEGSAIDRLRWNFDREPPIMEPELVDGVARVYCSSGPSLTSVLLPAGQDQPHVAKRACPRFLRERVHRSYLSEALSAADRGDHVHLWCHLWDLANEVQWPLVADFLEHVGKARHSGLEIATLAELEQRAV